MSKLSYANIKGFEAKESLIEEHKHSITNIDPDTEYAIDDENWNAYH